MDQARAEGKKAVFVNGNVFISGNLYQENKGAKVGQDQISQPSNNQNTSARSVVPKTHRISYSAPVGGSRHSSSYSLPPPIRSPSQSQRPSSLQQPVGTNHIPGTQVHISGTQHFFGGQRARGSRRPPHFSRQPPRLQKSSIPSEDFPNDYNGASNYLSASQSSGSHLGVSSTGSCIDQKDCS